MKPLRKLRIERLVLHGFDRAQGERVAAALRAGLERQLAGGGPARSGDAGTEAAKQLMRRLDAARTAPREGRR